MINNKTYLYIFDAKFSLKGTYNVNETVKFENCHNDTLSVLLLWAFHVALHFSSLVLLSSTRPFLLARVQHFQPLSQSQFIPSDIKYLATLTHYAWVSRLWTKDIDLTHQGQFLTPDSQILTNRSLTHDDFASFFVF